MPLVCPLTRLIIRRLVRPDPNCWGFIVLSFLSALCDANVVAAGCSIDPDLMWMNRAKAISDNNYEAIDQVIACYEQRTAKSPPTLEPYWKLMRALYFKGAFLSLSKADQRAVFERATQVAELAFDGLDRNESPPAAAAAAAGNRTSMSHNAPIDERQTAAAVYFWAGVSWGFWAKTTGGLHPTRMGVAKRIRDYASAVISLDPHLERAGGHRLLGRLHAETPRIPWITGWIDRDIAVRELEHAFNLYPTDPYNALYFAQALLEFRPERRTEAMSIIRDLLARAPNPLRQVEDQGILDEADSILNARPTNE